MFFVWSQKRINVKVAWWGAAGAGKTQTIHAIAAEIRERSAGVDVPEREGRQATGMRRNAWPHEVDERTLRMTTYFCHPPGELGEFGGWPLHYQLKCAEPPHEANDAQRKVLDGISAVVLCADARPDRQNANEAALRELVDRMAEREELPAGALGVRLEALFGVDTDCDLILQVNHADAPQALAAERVHHALMLPRSMPSVTTQATTGEGVWRLFEAVGHRLRPLLVRAQKRGRIPAADPSSI